MDDKSLEKHLINLGIEDLDTPIYRIFPFYRLEDIVKNKELGLLIPRFWDDPVENWLVFANYTCKNGERQSIQSGNFVGMCWTFQEESDAMWRLYSPVKGAVKVKTTVRKLLTSILNGTASSGKEVNTFLGKVKYKSKKGIISDLTKNAKEYTSTNEGQANTFLMKPSYASHEQELRVLFKRDTDKEVDAHYIKIDWEYLIDEVVMDPRIKDTRTISIKQRKLNAVGFNRELVRSDLYRFKNISLNFDL